MSEENVVDTSGGDRTPAEVVRQQAAETRLLHGAMGKVFDFDDPPLDEEVQEAEPVAPPPPRHTPRPTPVTAAQDSLQRFISQAADPANQREIRIGIEGVFNITFQAPFYSNSAKTAATILAPEGFELELHHDSVYDLEIAGKLYRAEYTGAPVRLPGFPWQMLSFQITVRDGNDETRSGPSGQNPVAHLWEALGDDQAG